MRIVDLSMPISDHFRWNPQVHVKGDKSGGDQFRVTSLATTCHGFTHVDAQAHFIAGAPTIEATQLENVVGACRLFDLSHVPENSAITAEQLASTNPGGKEGDILLLSTQWDQRRDYQTREFWTDAPWLTREASEYLLKLKPRALAVDFPQDYPIRLLLDGIRVPDEEHVTHDVLLRAGVTLIEYVVNTAALTSKRFLLSAAPLKVVNADGAPSRVFAIEGEINL
ncbi:cyclase family protein [Brucella pseudogrignonensis]|uniref:cyclase family protein n=1 Tax=Brucella pseudogrignonensis TaxID=419475 RepID=UPI0028B69310|nr:cyclase family protein [Brucella pseudogrignonensis]MDT6941713.1 cyclase family protein [Brucella pseudogrignonensis]